MMVGIDLVKISRIEKFYQKFGTKAWKRFLSDEEIALLNNSVQRAAGFWAAKEAISKALGCGICEFCTFHDILIHKDRQNAPYFTLSKYLINHYQITSTALSITHDDGYAIAVATILSQKNETKPLAH